jgi:hypothetical protein
MVVVLMRILFAISFIFSLGLVTPTQAELVIDNQPTRVGGLFSDTEFVDDFNQELFQRVADDLTLAEPAVIRRAGFWGFYNLNNPPATETIRMRFYGARPGDGLPDESNIVYEESFLNPSRTATGHIVFVGIGPLEYFYEVDMSSPVSLAADTPYWLEIAQIGDIDTAFRWEFSGLGSIGLAAVNTNVPDWQLTNFDADNAYQLSTIPEPTTASMLAMGILHMVLRRGGKGGRMT